MKTNSAKHSPSRRDFLVASAVAGSALGLPASQLALGVESESGRGPLEPEAWRWSLEQNPFVKIDSGVVICDGPGRRHRAFPTAVLLPNSELLVGFRVGSDHHMTHDGAFYLSRSTDLGRSWQTPFCLCSAPGWDVCANLAQYPNGVMPKDEPFLHALLRWYRWRADMPQDAAWRDNPTYVTISSDHGRNWQPVTLFSESISEVETDRGPMKFWGLQPHSYNSTLHRLADGRVMGLFVGRGNLKVYNPAPSGSGYADTAMAGFSADDMKSWTYRIIADNSQGGIGYSESDSVRLASGRYVAIYGNNDGSPWFFETHSDDEGQTWAPMRQLNFAGDSPSMIQLAGGPLLAAIRNGPPSGKPGIGLVASADEGRTWRLLKNVHDQANWDMGYPDLVRLPNGRILLVYYTAAEPQPIPNELKEQLAATEPQRTILKGFIRPAAYGELQSEIRGVFLEDLTM